MEIEHLILGEFQTNCYIIRRSKTTADCLIIDVGLDADKIIDFLEAERLNPVAVILTHGHIDHIAGLEQLRLQYPDLKVYIHKQDAQMLTGEKKNLSELMGVSFRTKPANRILNDGQLIEQAGIILKVIHTPGHTPGGISLHSKKDGILFSGDSLFADSVGRTDFPGGSTQQLIQSIKDRLLTLPAETIVYPGHGPITTIGREKATNPFI
jgi:hydroxyacylglutathione hydrolase